MDTPPNPTITNILGIAYSGANIHLSRQATPTLIPVLMDNEIKARLSDGRTMYSTHIATLQQPGICNLARQIHILPKIYIDLFIYYWESCVMIDALSHYINKQYTSRIKENK